MESLSELRQCHNCGLNVPPLATLCPHCGARLIETIDHPWLRVAAALLLTPIAILSGVLGGCSLFIGALASEGSGVYLLAGIFFIAIVVLCVWCIRKLLKVH